ncbi:MAG: TetR/AcrR family transcriptional regulator [Pseudomonadota bacterium]
MFDATDPHDRIIEATLQLAGEHDWSDVTLSRIATAADVTLADARASFATRTDILKAFAARIDSVVLTRMAEDGDATDNARDRLFDVLMTRFEVMMPYKPALRRLAKAARRGSGVGLELTSTVFTGQRWMLEAAGIETQGLDGRAHLLGSTAIYMRVFDVWLSDDDAGMAKTMAALDSRLRRGEKAMERIDDAVSLMRGFARMAFSGRRRDRDDAAADADDARSSTSTSDGAAPQPG